MRRFEIDDGALRIVDLESSNGTRLGTTRVKDAYAYAYAYLQSGDIARVDESCATRAPSPCVRTGGSCVQSDLPFVSVCR